MKGLLEFELPQEREDFELAQNGSKYKFQLDEIWERIFRPHYKHGYTDKKVTELLDYDQNCQIVFKHFEQLYRSIINED